MRTSFIKTLDDLASCDKRIILLTGDLGFTVFENFKEAHPGQFLNAGVAEQNMVGVAAGLALSGKIVFAYSIAPFVTLRCIEHLKIDVCFHNLNVNIVGVGGGFGYGIDGTTHHATEDIAIMRSLPNMTVVCPGDPYEVGLCVRAASLSPGPFYIRLGKAGEPAVHATSPKGFEIGKAIVLKNGQDVSLFSSGNMLETAAAAAKILEQKGISVRLISMHTVKPLDTDAVLSAARETRAVFTLEEHSIIGGLGGATAEVLAEYSSLAPLKILGAADQFADCSGSQKYHRHKHGLTPESVAIAVERFLLQKGI
jgi:transketolase